MTALTAERVEVPADAEAFYELSLAEGWGDGAPVLLPTDERVLCLLCAYVAYDPDPDVLEKLLSNATPEAQPGIGTRITPNLDAIKSRVLAMVRQEDRR